MSWSLVLLTTICFGMGFGLSWVRARRRVRARIKHVLEAEVRRELNAELIKRIERGDEPELTSVRKMKNAAGGPSG